MANLATEADFKEAYPEHEEQVPGVVNSKLTRARSFIVGFVTNLTSVEADADGLVAMKEAEMMLAFEALSTKPSISVGGKTVDAGKMEGDRARDLLDVWLKNKLGSTTLHKETIVSSPTFTEDAPETWDIDPSTST